MTRNKLPHVFICQSATDKICYEAERWYQKGITTNKHPWEAAMYPLAYFQLRPGIHKSPLELVNLSEIDFIVITYALFPIDRFKDYGPSHARFKPGANDHLNPIINDYINRYPRLDTFCKMHSHPCGGRRLSPGDLYHNILNSYPWMRSKGLNTMFSIVLTPTETYWYFNCYGLNNFALNVKLECSFVSKNHSLVKVAKQRPYYQTEIGSQWCDHNKGELKKANYQITRNTLNHGWRRYTIHLQQNVVVVAIPPDFPLKPVKVYRVTNNPQNNLQEILIPRSSLWSQSKTDLTEYYLLDLVKTMEKQI